MRLTRAVVPTLFTVLNMFCGFLSIVNSSNGQFVEASFLILLAGLFDSLDGMMARLTKSSSQFGVEIDSLSDVVSFGAAPAFLVYKLQLFQLGGVGIIISSLLVILGGIRLARFNVQLVGYDKEYFNGLPIPASAMAVIAFVLSFIVDEKRLTETAELILPYLVVVLSLLMVSTIKYETFPKISKREITNHPVKFISLFFAVLLVVFTKGDAFVYLMGAFILFGVVRHTIKHLRHNKKTDDEIEEIPSYDV